MRVLNISGLYPYPQDQFYGIAIHKQNRAIAEKGCEQKTISPIACTPFPIKYLSRKWKLYSQIPSSYLIDEMEVYYPRCLVFPKALFLASSGLRTYWGIKKLVSKIYLNFPFELIHAHTALPDGFAGMLISMKYRKPLVLTFQATDLDITANRGKSCSSSLYKVFKYADQVISPSPRLAKLLVSRFGIKPTIIGYGIDEREILADNSEIQARFRNRHLLLSVSRLISTKGIELNIRAFKKLINKYENLLLLVVGDGPERNRLETLTSELDLNRNVIFLGHLSHKEAMEYMSACEIFSMPSYQETFGLVYIEAMAHGRPVIAVRGQGVDGIVIHGETGLLIKPNDVNSLVEAMDFLLGHPSEAIAMGSRARKLVIENYTIMKNAEKTIDIYNRVTCKV